MTEKISNLSSSSLDAVRRHVLNLELETLYKGLQHIYDRVAPSEQTKIKGVLTELRSKIIKQ